MDFEMAALGLSSSLLSQRLQDEFSAHCIQVIWSKVIDARSIPTVFFDHVSQFYDVFTLFILLASLESMLLENDLWMGY